MQQLLPLLGRRLLRRLLRPLCCRQSLTLRQLLPTLCKRHLRVTSLLLLLFWRLLRLLGCWGRLRLLRLHQLALPLQQRKLRVGWLPGLLPWPGHRVLLLVLPTRQLMRLRLRWSLLLLVLPLLL